MLVDDDRPPKDGGQQKPEVEITFERQRWRRDSNGYPHIIDHARLHYVTANIARRGPTTEIQDCDR